MSSTLPNENQVDKADEPDYGLVVSGIYTQAQRNKSLRDSGLIENYSDLANAIQIAVIHRIYVLYKRETYSYYFVDLSIGEARVLKIIQNADKLNISSLVAIVESLIDQGVYIGNQESCETESS